jgi:hypothetical protein
VGIRERGRMVREPLFTAKIIRVEVFVPFSRKKKREDDCTAEYDPAERVACRR